MTPTQEQKDRNSRRAAELEFSLRHHVPKPEQVERIQALREAAWRYGDILLTLTLPGREQALAITGLEESLMWAVKGIVLER